MNGWLMNSPRSGDSTPGWECRRMPRSSFSTDRIPSTESAHSSSCADTCGGQSCLKSDDASRAMWSRQFWLELGPLHGIATAHFGGERPDARGVGGSYCPSASELSSRIGYKSEGTLRHAAVLRQNSIHLRFQQLSLSFSKPKFSRSGCG